MAQVGGWFRDVALRGIDFGAGRWHRRGIEGRPDVVARRGAAVVTRKYTLRLTVHQPFNYHRGSALSYLRPALPSYPPQRGGEEASIERARESSRLRASRAAESVAGRTSSPRT